MLCTETKQKIKQTLFLAIILMYLQDFPVLYGLWEYARLPTQKKKTSRVHFPIFSTRYTTPVLLPIAVWVNRLVEPKVYYIIDYNIVYIV